MSKFEERDDFSTKALRAQRLTKKAKKQNRNYNKDFDDEEMDSIEDLGVRIKGLR